MVLLSGQRDRLIELLRQGNETITIRIAEFIERISDWQLHRVLIPVAEALSHSSTKEAQNKAFQIALEQKAHPRFMAMILAQKGTLAGIVNPTTRAHFVWALYQANEISREDMFVILSGHIRAGRV